MPTGRRRLAWWLLLALGMCLCLCARRAEGSVALFGAASKEKEPEEEEEAGGVLAATIDKIQDGIEDLHESVQEARAKVRARVKQRAADVKEAVLDLHDNVSDMVEDAFDDVREYLGIEKVEEGLEAVKRRTQFLRRIVLKGVVGAGMLLYGIHFSHLVVFAHTVRVTGLPVVARAWDELVEMYFNARKTIKKEFPNVLKAKQLLQAVNYEISATRKILSEAKEAAKDGTVTKAEARDAIKKAKVNLRELNQKSYLINQSLSSMSAVIAAINFQKVKQLLQGIYTSALACFAAASSSTLRGLSIGFDLAALISRHIDHAVAAIIERIPQVEIFKVLPKETQKLLGVALGLVSIVKGLFVVHFVVPKMTLVLSSSALGAVWMTDALAEVTDQQAGGEGKGLLRDKALYLLTNIGLTAAGVFYQSSRAGDEMPRWTRALLYPALRLEEILRHLDGAFGVGRDRLHQLIFHKNRQAKTAAAAEAPVRAAAAPARRRFGFGGFGRGVQPQAAQGA